jgi:hypothetical protein
MKIKITSDGTFKGTRVHDPVTGDALGAVQSVTLRLGGDGITSALVSGTIVTAKQEFVVEGDFTTAHAVIDRFLTWALAKLEPATVDDNRIIEALRNAAVEYEKTQGA